MKVMPRRSKLKLPPINLGEETLGQRIARLRKEKGLTQAELTRRMGLVQALISDYERGKLRPHAEMVARFSIALEVSADEILGLDKSQNISYKPSLRLLRRMRKIEDLTPSQQKALLRTIDTFLKGALV